LHSCHLGDSGGQVVLDFLDNATLPRLKDIDLTNNYIGFKTCSELHKAQESTQVRIHLAGNRVLDEIFNAVSHGLGEILVILGSFLLWKKIRRKPMYYAVAIGLYCASLNTLYLSSTLYHAFFALGRTTVYIFSILDYSSIFLLIAGSYSPFLGILFHDETWATALLSMMWVAAIVGVCTAAFYRGPFAQELRLTLYLVMGWAIIICARPLAMRLSWGGSCWLLLGGVLYTAGVPFFCERQASVHCARPHCLASLRRVCKCCPIHCCLLLRFGRYKESSHL